MNSYLKTLKNGLIDENPTFVQFLGMCPTLATTTSVKNGLSMGLCATAVLICSNVVISLVRKFIPNKIRIASYIVIIAGFVTMIDLLMKAYFPELSKSLGIFIPLIVVNCIILGRAEAFASKNSVLKSALDGIGMGLGFTVALFLISSVREIIGNGTFFDISLFGPDFKPALIAILPPGAFIIFGFIIAAVNAVRRRFEKNA